VLDPRDPRAPSQELWESLSEKERQSVVDSLPSESLGALPPEGDAHRRRKNEAVEALSEYYRSRKRSIYLSSELPVYYPAEAMFAPDLLAVLDVPDHDRMSWVVSREGKGLDFAFELHVGGDWRKDAERNVERFARLGILEYFAFDLTRARLLGWRLPRVPASKSYEAIVPQAGRWRSNVLDLDLSVEDGRVRFYDGRAALLDGREWIARLSQMVDAAILRAEEEARRAEEEARRAERLAARLRELGEDPDKL